MIKCHLTADAIMDIGGTVGGFVGFSLLSGWYLNIHNIVGYYVIFKKYQLLQLIFSCQNKICWCFQAWKLFTLLQDSWCLFVKQPVQTRRRFEETRRLQISTFKLSTILIIEEKKLFQIHVLLFCLKMANENILACFYSIKLGGSYAVPYIRPLQCTYNVYRLRGYLVKKLRNHLHVTDSQTCSPRPPFYKMF